MSSFPLRPMNVWRSSIAEQIAPIRGVFEFLVVDPLMVQHTLDFLREWRLDQGIPPGSPIAPVGYKPADHETSEKAR
jgi:hypothetical protein